MASQRGGWVGGVLAYEFCFNAARHTDVIEAHRSGELTLDQIGFPRGVFFFSFGSITRWCAHSLVDLSLSCAFFLFVSDSTIRYGLAVVDQN